MLGGRKGPNARRVDYGRVAGGVNLIFENDQGAEAFEASEAETRIAAFKLRGASLSG